MTASPIVARWELSRRLATRRRELGLDVKAITEHLKFTRNYWSAVENDRTLIAAEKLDLLMDLMDFSDDDRTELIDLRAAAKKKGWWDDYPTMADEAKHLCGLEFGATEIRTYENLLVPGLLQTTEYARAIVESDPYVSATSLEVTLGIREQRRRQLLDERRVSYTALISEAVVRQQVAGPEVQRRQLEAMLELAESADNGIEILVIPFETYPGVIAGSATLVFFEFARPHLPQLAWQEAVRAVGAIEEDDEQFLRLDMAWRSARDRALSRSKSCDFLRSAATA